MHYRLRTLLIGVVSMPLIGLACYGAIWVATGDERLATMLGGIGVFIGTVILAASALNYVPPSRK